MSTHRFSKGLVCSALIAAAGIPVAHAQADLLSSLQSAQVVDLNFVWDSRSPLLSFNPPFAAALVNSHRQTKGWIPQITFAADMMFFSGQHGAPTIDALGHISHDGKMFGGLAAEENEGPNGLTALGIETYPKDKYLNRGVLLDVARYKGADALAPGYEITRRRPRSHCESAGGRSAGGRLGADPHRLRQAVRRQGQIHGPASRAGRGSAATGWRRRRSS